MKIWSLRQSLPEIKSFNTYLYRMTRNAVLNYLRDKKVTLEISEISIRDDKDIEQEYYTKEKELLIQLIVDQMPAQRRKVFTMSRWFSVPVDEDMLLENSRM